MNKFTSFSKKQLTVLSFWRSDKHDYQSIICDGAVRSGKTVSMSISFILWSMFYFNNCSFAICGKTITSARRNIIIPLLPLLKDMGFTYKDILSRNYIDIIYRGHTNRFYIFGGKDESSASSIQGMTLGGILFDEVALMPRSFVEQALARCSITGSKFWFNCNPEHPHHWFYLEWIQKAKQKNVLYLHFTMNDNPSLCPTVRKRYQTLYSGAFYDRFVLGKWVAVAGVIYCGFKPDTHIIDTLPSSFSEYYISCDYGTVNPTSMGLWGKCGEVWYRIREYYYDSKLMGEQKTDQQYYQSLLSLA
ncbi:MAG: PBSX family phage terminase large subunit, partial [Oscillospiraceae bacterium]